MNELYYFNRRGLRAVSMACIIAGFIAIQSLAFSTPARATWNLVKQFNLNQSYVSSSWFFNPMVGIIGFHWTIVSSDAGMVKRTTDGGVTWTDCTVPALINTAPQVSDIWFSDLANGWLTWYGGVNGQPMLWRTNDSGKTWTDVGLTEPFDGPASVYQTPNALIVTEALGVGVWTSTDTGVTWTMKGVQKNGIDFDDNLNGIISEWGERGSTTFLITTDGGLNWNNAPGGVQVEGWGVYAVKHGQIFVSVPEDTTIRGVSQPSPAYRSVNNGRDWSQMTTLPIRTTGAVQGVYGIIYTQSCGGIPGATVPHGLFRSNDSGQTWVGVGGPDQGTPDPYSICDTRFSVTGCGNTVYASDGTGGLWKTTDGGNGDFIGQCEFVNNDTLAPLNTTICDTLGNLFFLHNPNVGPVIIQDLSIFDSSRRPAKTDAVYFDSLPNPYTPIGIHDSVAFGLAWHPGAMEDSTGADSVTIRVIFYVSYFNIFPESGLNPLDTVFLRVKLTGISTQAEYAIIPKTINTPTLVICNSVDTIINLINQGCDSILINSAALLKNAWTFTGKNGSPIKLPFYLHSGDTLPLRVQATPVSQTVLFDSLQVKMHYMGQDTAFGIGLRTKAKPGVSLTNPAALQFDSVATCISTTQNISLPNIGCDTVTITQADLADQHFELLDANGVPLKLPLKIPGDSVLQLMVRFTPTTLGAKSGIIDLHYQYAGDDSIHSIALSGIGSASGTVAFPTTFNFNDVSICGSADSTISIANKTCLKIFVDSLVIPAPFASLDSALLPFEIDTGQSAHLHVGYKPGGKQTETVQVYLKLDINAGATQVWDTLTFLGTGISGSSGFQTTLLSTNSTINFDTLSTCGTVDSISFKVFNPGCDVTTFTGLSLDPGISGTFAASANQSLPVQLIGGDSVTVTVAVLNLIANSYSGNLHLQYTLSDGTSHDFPAPISLTVVSGGGSSVLNMKTPNTFDFGNIPACSTSPDTTIVLSNGGCVADTVRFTIAGKGFLLGSGPDSVIIPAEGTTAIHVSYDGSTPDTLASTVTLSSTAAIGSSYTVQLQGIVPPPGNVIFNINFSKMPVSPGDFFNVYLIPDRPISGAGLKEISGVIEYHSNSFEAVPGATSVGTTMTIGPPYTIGTIAYYPFDFTSADIPLIQNTPVLTIPLEAVVSDTDGGMIWLDSLKLNKSDPNYGSCTLSANTNSPGANTTINNQCGDSTLVLILRDKPLFSSERLRPNPVTQESGYKTTLNLVSAEDGVAEITLYDALGQVVSRGAISLNHDQAQDYTFDLHDLTSGSYYYSLLFNGQTAAGNLRGTLLLVK